VPGQGPREALFLLEPGIVSRLTRTGFRASELTALHWDQIHLKAGTLHVARLKHGSPSMHPLRGPELNSASKFE